MGLVPFLGRVYKESLRWKNLAQLNLLPHESRTSSSWTQGTIQIGAFINLGIIIEICEFYKTLAKSCTNIIKITG